MMVSKQLLLATAKRHLHRNPHRSVQILRNGGGGGGGGGDAVGRRPPSFAGSREKFFNRPGPWDEPDLGTLIEANKRWTQRMVTERPEYFRELKKGHAPKILWIGCSDARVPANEIIGEPPGSVFVHRNIANLVVNTDFNCMSVIQYAVSVLKVKHIIVCGHYDCGGVKASLEATDHRSPLVNWLRHLRDTYRLHRDELNSLSDMLSRQRRLVELNVIEQCVNIMKTAPVQLARVETRKMKGVEGSGITFKQPRVHGMVYEPRTGEAKFLDIDFKETMNDLKGIYDLHQGGME